MRLLISGRALKAWARRAAHLALFALMLAAVLPAALIGRLRVALLRRRGRHPRSVFGPSPILFANHLSAALRRLGHASETVTYHPYYITAAFDWRFDRWRETRILHILMPYAVFAWAAYRFDIFHFFYDGGYLRETPFRRLELPLLSALGKLTIVMSFGGDVRTRDACGRAGPFHTCLFCPEPGRFCICDDARGRANYLHHRRHATLCCSAGDCVDYTPGSFNGLFYTPIDTRAFRPVPGGSVPGRVRVVHASNHRWVKGTHILERAIAELAAEGIPIDLAVVEKVPNDEARRIYETADVIYDQCLLGIHGIFALEGIALGKPVLTFVRHRDYLPLGIEPPFVIVTPMTLKARLRALALDPERRLALGRAGRSYCERVFSYEACGARLLRVHRDLLAGRDPAGGARRDGQHQG